MTLPKNRLAVPQVPRQVRGLRLRRPLAVLDLETTGTNPSQDRIVEISILRLSLNGSEELLGRRVNPQVPIPAEATAVHGISDADVAGEPTFSELAVEIAAFLKDCDIAGFNVIRFDLPMLGAEFQRVGVDFSREGRSVVDAMTIFHQKEPRDLAGASMFYLGRDMVDAHSSESDARTTLDVLAAQLERYAHCLRKSKNSTNFVIQLTRPGLIRRANSDGPTTKQSSRLENTRDEACRS